MKWLHYACHFVSTLVKEVVLDHIRFHPQEAGDKKNKMVKNMKNEMKNEQSDNVAAIGIGAMIVFIALILVAAVAAAVIIQTAEKLQQNAQSTGEDTTDMMASKVSILNVVIPTAGALHMTFELAPGSDNVPAAAVDFNIVCAGGIDAGDFGTTTGATSTVAAVVGGATATTLVAGQTYDVTITPATCAPATNTDHTFVVQSGGGGFTYEVLKYGGSVAAGSVVV